MSAVLMVLASAQSARADATVFLGATPTPSSRPVTGWSVGVGLLVIGFEFEYASTQEDADRLAPSLRTGMGNVLVQTPTGVQIYGTMGAGVYRERLGQSQVTGFGINSGGGVKIPLVGPLRARVDYRLFTLRGSPLHARVQRVYAGANLRF
jgi:hypothetical protein